MQSQNPEPKRNMFPRRCIIALLLVLFQRVTANEIVVETIRVGIGPRVRRDCRYEVHLTLYIKDAATNSLTPSGWTSRKEDGAEEDLTMFFQPHARTDIGSTTANPEWIEGLMQMREGERANLHVPSEKGYGSRPVGTPESRVYIPANSDLLFDIEILGKKDRVPDPTNLIVVDTIREGNGPRVMRGYSYVAHLTLYIEDRANGNLIPSGWTTREEDGASENRPFVFQPAVNVIAPGWAEGVLQMAEGERANIHVPSELGFGDRVMGAPDSRFYVPANSDLLFDVEVLGKDL